MMRESIGALLVLERARLTRVARRAGCNTEEAEDAVTATALIVLERAARIEPSSACAYLSKVCWHESLHLLRERGRCLRGEDAERAIEEVAAPDEFEALFRDEHPRAGDVRAALASLSEWQRTALLELYDEPTTHRAYLRIAERHGRSYCSVNKAIAKGRDRLYRELAA